VFSLADHQSVNELVGKIVDANLPGGFIYFGRPREIKGGSLLFLPSHLFVHSDQRRIFAKEWRRAHNSETFPVLETRPMNGDALPARIRLMRGSALTKAAAISVPWSWLEVNTKALTFADAIAIRSVTR
jgi:hypothetical protein